MTIGNELELTYITHAGAHTYIYIYIYMYKLKDIETNPIFYQKSKEYQYLLKK